MIYWARFSNNFLFHESKYHVVVKEKESTVMSERLMLLQNGIELLLGGTLDEEIPNFTLKGYKI